ncbi:choice-of-anchor G family protein [Nakamurella sp. YIM 132087]|uniref:Choice-of-anchor G family protein n=1 Tax=Nakamurella alba TaxID=2665158 RepID=A0A7K1FK43_9ACTN|nr:IPT/TIG domain-containing protein [Nakamurella alba]MTD14456.1 choice-of-anchor G family protein [Nakamurella alba]
MRSRARAAAALLLVPVLLLMGTTPVLAGPGDVSAGSARFLGGTLLAGGVPLNSIVSLGGAAATNSGTATPITDVTGLEPSVLSALTVNLPGGLNIPLPNLLTLGVANQYAQASDNGISRAGSGAVSNDGSVSLDGSNGFPSGATLQLQQLLGAAFAGQVADLQVQLGAITGVAAQDASLGGLSTTCRGAGSSLSAPVNCRDYSIAGGQLRITSPAVAGITTLLTGAGGVAPTVDTAVNSLVGPNGLIAQALQTVLGVTGLLGNGGLTVSITANTTAALNTILDTPITSADGAVTINLRTGLITANIDQLLTAAGSAGLANLAPNSEILSAAVLNALVADVASILNGVPALVSTALTAALNAATLLVNANVCLLQIGATCVTRVNVNVNGTLAQVIAGTAPASLALVIAGAPVVVPLSTLLAALAVPISAVLFNPTTGVIATVTNASSPLRLGVTAIVNALGPVLRLINTVVSLTGNVQETPSAGVSREVALRATLLQSSVAVVDLGRAQVGPNVDATPPTAASLSPNTGPAAGGTSVTVTGTNFVAGATTVSVDGTAVPAGSVTVNSATSLTFTTPSHAPGPVPVVITTSGGSSPPITYTYQPVPVPVIQAPAEGAVLATTTPVISGTSAAAGTVTVTEGGVTVCTATVSAGAWSCTPASPLSLGDHSVVATLTDTGGNVSDPTAARTFSLQVVPTLTGIDPASGPVAGGQTVTLTGTGFTPGTTVTIGGVSAGGVNVVDGGTLTFVTPPHTAGPVTVTVTTPGGTSNTQPYTYIPAPAISALDPTAGPAAGGQTVTVDGSGFVVGATSVTIGGTLVPAAAVTVNSPTSLTFTTPAHAPGGVQVSVTAPGGTSGSLGYTYVPAPVITDMTPTIGPVAGGQTVTVTGTDFDPTPGATSVTVDGITVPAGDVTVSSANELTFLTPAHAAGGAQVRVVTTTGGTSGPQPYTYVPVPGAASLTPVAGPQAGGTLVTVTGSGFVPGVTTVTSDGTAVPAGDVTVVNGTTLTYLTPAHAQGPVDVVVSTPGGSSTPPLTFTYNPFPTAAALSPAAGPITGGQLVTVTGTGFVPGATSVTIDGTVIPAAGVTVSSPTSLTFVTPAHAAAAVDVTVDTPNGTTAPLTYTYLPTPTAASIAPDTGELAGGYPAVITGTGFVPGVTTVTFDGATLVPAVNAGGTTATITVPAGTVAGVPVAVVVTNGPGSTAAPLEFTYAAPSITASTPVSPGTSSLITGSGWPANTLVTIQLLDAASAPVAGGVTTATTDADGDLPTGTALPIPVGTPLGGGYSAASSDANGNTATAPITVQAPPPGTPVIDTLTPAGVGLPGGETVTIQGEGFLPGISTVLVNGVTVPSIVLAPDTMIFPAPPGTEPGPVTVQVTNGPGLLSNALFLEYADPTVTVTGPVPAGTDVPVSGAGWPPADALTVQLLDPVGTPVGAPAAVTTGVGGGFGPVDLPVPATAAPGTYSVRVSDGAGTAITEPLGVTAAAPTATAIDPAAGPATGGQTVTITGTGLQYGPTTVSVGGTPATDVTPAPDGTSLTFTTPPGTPGAVGVTVTTAGGTTTPALTYTYVAAPTSDALAPGSGPIAGGTTVSMTGTGFVPGATTVTIGGITVPAADVTVNGTGTALAFDTPAHATGTVDVTATTIGGTTAPLAFTYLPVPTATTIDPAAGPVGGGQTVSITGSGFVAGATTVAFDGVPGTAVTVTPGGTSLTVVTPAHVAGTVPVTVTTPGGTSAPLDYDYLPAPTATALDPVQGPAAGGQTVTVTGTGFVPDLTTVSIGGVDIDTADVDVTSPTSLSFTTPAHAPGAVTVSVQTPGGASAPLAYTYVAAPVVTSLTPDHGTESGGTTVTVTGSGFVAGETSLTIGGLTVDPADVDVTAPTSLSFVTPAHAPGTVQVRVLTVGGTSGPLPYTYDPVPTAASLSPDTGPLVGGTLVTVTGTGFVPGLTGVTLDGTPTPVTVGSDTSLTFLTPPGVVAGDTLAVVVTNGVGAESTPPLTFTYGDPTVSAGSPGVVGTPTPVTGTGWPAGAAVTITLLDGATPVTGATISTTTTASGTFPGGVLLPLPDGTPAGTHTVSADDGEGNTATDTLVVITTPPPAAPTIDAIAPDSGPLLGGTEVTLTGTGFVPGTVVLFDGTEITPDAVSGTELTFTVPAGTLAGPVSVQVQNPDDLVSGVVQYTYDDPQLTADDPVAAGGTLSVDATGWPADDDVSIVLIGPDGPITAPVTVTTSGTGTLSDVPVTVPFSTPPGTYTLRATDAAGNVVTTEITVTAVVPTLSALTPDSGPLTGGQTVTVTGTGFLPGTVVRVGDVEITPTAVDPDGTSLTFVTPPGGLAGGVPVTVVSGGQESDPLTYDYLDPELSAGPTVLKAGESTTVSGTGWPPGAEVTVQLATPDGTPVGDPVTVTAGDDGTFEVSVPVPAGTPSGPYVVVAGDTAGNSVDTDITVVPRVPVIRIVIPTHGPLPGGTEVTVGGDGFGPDTTVDFGGTTVTPDSVSDDGTELTFTTPPGTVSGVVRVTLVNGPGAVSDPIEFTFDAPLVTATSPVPPGGTSTIGGGCWPVGDVVTVQLVDADGDAVPGTAITVTAGSDCTISGGLPIPADLPLGDWTVQAVDGYGNVATTTVTVSTAAAPLLSLRYTSQVQGTAQLNAVFGSGWEAGSTVQFLLDYDTAAIAGVTVAADGSFGVDFGVSGLALGEHTVTAAQERADGSVATQVVRFTIVPPGGLSYTGFDLWDVFPFAWLLMLAGVAFVVIGRRRRRS